MTGTLTESRHTEHSSSEPLANTTRSFSIKRSRISAGVAEAPKYVVWKIRVLRVAVRHNTNWDSEGGEKSITKVCRGFRQQIWVAAVLSELHEDDQHISIIP